MERSGIRMHRAYEDREANMYIARGATRVWSEAEYECTARMKTGKQICILQEARYEYGAKRNTNAPRVCNDWKEVITMRDRLEPCIYYVCKDADCKKGFVKVDMKKCKNCPKYQPRKNSQKKESVKDKRQKDKDRHDSWKREKY